MSEKIIAFKIENTLYSVDINSTIKEIVLYPKKVTMLPNQSVKILGIFDNRGEIVLLLNISNLLNVNDLEYKYVIIFENNKKLIGLPVSELPLTMNVDSKQTVNNTIKYELIKNIVTVNDIPVVILDDKKLFEI